MMHGADKPDSAIAAKKIRTGGRVVRGHRSVYNSLTNAPISSLLVSMLIRLTLTISCPVGRSDR